MREVVTMHEEMRRQGGVGMRRFGTRTCTVVPQLGWRVNRMSTFEEPRSKEAGPVSHCKESG